MSSAAYRTPVYRRPAAAAGARRSSSSRSASRSCVSGGNESEARSTGLPRAGAFFVSLGGRRISGGRRSAMGRILAVRSSGDGDGVPRTTECAKGPADPRPVVRDRRSGRSPGQSGNTSRACRASGRRPAAAERGRRRRSRRAVRHRHRDLRRREDPARRGPGGARLRRHGVGVHPHCLRLEPPEQVDRRERAASGVLRDERGPFVRRNRRSRRRSLLRRQSWRRLGVRPLRVGLEAARRQARRPRRAREPELRRGGCAFRQRQGRADRRPRRRPERRRCLGVRAQRPDMGARGRQAARPRRDRSRPARA